MTLKPSQHPTVIPCKAIPYHMTCCFCSGREMCSSQNIRIAGAVEQVILAVEPVVRSFSSSELTFTHLAVEGYAILENWLVRLKCHKKFFSNLILYVQLQLLQSLQSSPCATMSISFFYIYDYCVPFILSCSVSVLCVPQVKQMLQAFISSCLCLLFCLGIHVQHTHRRQPWKWRDMSLERCVDTSDPFSWRTVSSSKALNGGTCAVCSHHVMTWI